VSNEYKMECAVCYEKSARCKLVCGHSFCSDCVKTWYTKGSGTCPMCRKKIHYRRMPLKKWSEEAKENEKQAIFEESVNEYLEYYPDIGVLDELQRTFRAIKESCDAEDIDYILNETADYYSDRRVHLNYRRSWLENGHQYKLAKEPKFKRNRH